MKTKEQRIEECGKKPVLMRGKNGILFVIPNYCHQRGCDNCDKYEAYKRRKKIQEVMSTEPGSVVRAVINEDDWRNIGNRLSEQGISYFSVMQDEHTRLIIASDNPYKRKDFGFVETSVTDAVAELCLDRNIFPEFGNRSSGGAWRYTEPRDEYTEEIYVYEFVPCFVPTKDLNPKYIKNGRVSAEFTNSVFAHANTWYKGKVGLEEAQKFMNFSMNKAIDLAEGNGARLELEGCKFQTKLIGKERIENWSIAYKENAERMKFQGDITPFSGKSYLLQHNIIEPHDHIGDYISYLEQNKKDRLKEELGDLYYTWYPEELDGEYNEEEQRELDAVVTY